MWQALAGVRPRTNTSRLLTTDDLASQLGLSPPTVRYLCDRFRAYIPAVGTGRDRRYPVQALELLRLLADGGQGQSVTATLEARLRDRLMARLPPPDDYGEELDSPPVAPRHFGYPAAGPLHNGATNHPPPLTVLAAPVVEAPGLSESMVTEIRTAIEEARESLQDGLHSALVDRDSALMGELATLRDELREAAQTTDPTVLRELSTLRDELRTGATDHDVALLRELNVLREKEESLQASIVGLKELVIDGSNIVQQRLRDSLGELQASLDEELAAVREQRAVAELKVAMLDEFAAIREQLSELQRPAPDLVLEEVRALRRDIAALRDEQIKLDLRGEARMSAAVQVLEESMHPWMGWLRALRKTLRRG